MMFLRVGVQKLWDELATNYSNYIFKTFSKDHVIRAASIPSIECPEHHVIRWNVNLVYQLTQMHPTMVIECG